MSLKNEPSNEISFRNGEGCLRVPQTREDDGGVYSCVASNPSGQDTTNCNVSCAGTYHISSECCLSGTPSDKFRLRTKISGGRCFGCPINFVVVYFV